MPSASWCVALALVVVAAAPATAADPFRDLNLLRPASSKPAPDFTVTGLAGERISLHDFRGRVVFLNFWATWCPPCKKEMPSMERLYRRYRDRGFVILAVSIDTGDKADVAAFVKAHGLTFPIGLDPTLEVANRYTVRALPSSFLVGKDSEMIAVALGPRDWDGAAAHALIEALLK